MFSLSVVHEKRWRINLKNLSRRLFGFRVRCRFAFWLVQNCSIFNVSWLVLNWQHWNWMGLVSKYPIRAKIGQNWLELVRYWFIFNMARPASKWLICFPICSKLIRIGQYWFKIGSFSTWVEFSSWKKQNRINLISKWLICFPSCSKLVEIGSEMVNFKRGSNFGSEKIRIDGA